MSTELGSCLAAKETDELTDTQTLSHKLQLKRKNPTGFFR